MNWVLGLTGGIASGKTRVANTFAELGAQIVDADVIAKSLVAPGSKTLATIAEYFGNEILSNGELNRARLRQRIFENSSDKKWLESLLHPLIRKTIENYLAIPNSAPYLILVAPLLFENGLDQLAQRTLVVDTSEEQQLERVICRDGGNIETAKAIMAAQMPRLQRLGRADDSIDNSGAWADTQKAIAILHQHYLQLAAAHDTHNSINPVPHL